MKNVGFNFGGNSPRINFRGLISIVFYSAITVGLAYFGVWIIMDVYDNLATYRANAPIRTFPFQNVEYISVTEAGIIAGWFTCGVICILWAIWLSSRLIWILVKQVIGSGDVDALPVLIDRNLHSLFTFAGMVFLALASGYSYYFAITDAIPEYIKFDHRGAHPHWASARSNDLIVGLVFGTAALVGAVYLALRLIADAVKYFLRKDGVI